MAKTRIVAGIEHVVYDSMEEFRETYPEGLVNLDWHKGQTGDWILADDGTIMQVLKRGKVKPMNNSSPKGYIRTLSGCFAIWHTVQLDSKFRESTQRFGGKQQEPTRVSDRNRVFAALVCLGRDPTEVYLQLYDTKNRTYARVKAYRLLKSELIMNEVKENIKKAGEESGATLDWAMKMIKKTVDKSKNDSVKIRGAGMIIDVHTKDKDSPGKLSEGGGAFDGLSEIPEGERRQLPEHSEEPQKVRIPEMVG